MKKIWLIVTNKITMNEISSSTFIAYEKEPIVMEGWTRRESCGCCGETVKLYEIPFHSAGE